MILLASQVLRILLVVIVLCAGCWYLRKKAPHKLLYCFGCIVILLAFVSYSLANLLPPITEQVTLTALNEKREEAKSAEVFLTGYTIDGKNFSSTSSLEVAEGHWFWTGASYAWRPETDHRRPSDLTRRVVISLPVGWNRTLNFSGGTSAGKVAVTIGDDTVISDLYSGSSTTQKIAIKKSSTGALLSNQIRHLIAYAVIFIGSACVILCVFLRVQQKPEKSKHWVKRNFARLVNGGIVFITFLLMFHWAGKFSFWIDELYEIYFTSDTLKNALHCSLMGTSANPPLEGLLYTIWYHLAPYGEQWLLLPSILFALASIYFIGLIIENLYGHYCSIFSVILSTCSITLWTNVAYEYRAYAMLLFFATLTLFFHIKRNQNPNRTKWTVIFSLCLAAMSMTHYWGMVVLTWYFFADLYLWRTKHIHWKIGLSYLFPGLLSITWLLMCQIVRGIPLQSISGWFGIPNLSSVLFLLKFLSGNTDIAYWLLYLGSAVALAYFFNRKLEFSWEIFYAQLSFVLMAGTVFFFMIYGNIINPKNTMWADRYFLVLLPNIFLLSALPLYMLTFLRNNSLTTQAQRILCLFIGLYLSLNCTATISSATTFSLHASATSTTRTSEPFREAADWLFTQKNYIYNSDTLVVTSWNEYTRSAWDEYYITQQGRRDPLNTVTYTEITKDNVLQYDRIYFLYRGSSKKYGDFLGFLEENYKLSAHESDLRIRVYVRK